MTTDWRSALAEELRLSPMVKTAVAEISKRSVIAGLSGITRTDDPSNVDWPRLMFFASVVDDTASDAAQDDALRVVQGVIESELATVGQRDAAGVLLERMGNRLGVRLALARDRLSRAPMDSAPGALKADVIQRELELAIPVTSGQVVAANPFQKQFWDAVESSDWVSVSAPTSAGKSYIVRRWIEERSVKASQFVCVYLVPTRALIEEVQEGLISDEAFFGMGIHSMPWDATIGQQAKEIFVLTQERFHILQQQRPDIVPDVIFVDEAQKFGDDERGVLLQRVVDQAARRSPGVQMIFASPLAENPETLLVGAPPDADTRAVTSAGVTVNQNLIRVNQVFRKPLMWTASVVVDGEAELFGKFTIPHRATSPGKRLPLVVAALGESKTGNLVYVNNPSDAEKVAVNLVELIGPSPSVAENREIAELVDLVQKTIHSGYLLAEVLQSGVGFHYGNMPLLVRAAIEALFRKGLLRYLVCTSTLLEGVNLPCQAIFVRGPRKGPGKVMTAYDFWNLAGRAGRWGKEFQGNIICVDTDDSQQWPVVPGVRRRQRISRATDGALVDGQSLVDFIVNRSPVDAARGWRLGESTFSFLAERVARGVDLASIPGLTSDGRDLLALEAAIQSALTEITIPIDVLSRHPGISPLLIQNLFVALSTHPSPSSLRLLLPEDRNAPAVYEVAMHLCDQHLGAPFGGDYEEAAGPKGDSRRRQLSHLITQWMRGVPLSHLINNRVTFYRRQKQARFNLASEIRGTMTDVEQFARFQAPRYLSCYAEVLALVVDDSEDDEAVALPDIAMMLELGVSRTTDMSMISLGLSRTTAVALAEFVFADDLTPAAALGWLRERPLDSLPLPGLVLREVRTVVDRWNAREPESGRG